MIVPANSTVMETAEQAGVVNEKSHAAVKPDEVQEIVARYTEAAQQQVQEVVG